MISKNLMTNQILSRYVPSLVAVLAIVMLLVGAAVASQAPRATAPDKTKVARNDTTIVIQQRNDLKLHLLQARARINSEIDRLRTLAFNSDENAKKNINAGIKSLDDSKDDLSERINNIGSTTRDNWKSFKADGDQAIKDAEGKIAKLKADFK